MNFVLECLNDNVMLFFSFCFEFGERRFLNKNSNVISLDIRVLFLFIGLYFLVFLLLSLDKLVVNVEYVF